MKKVCLFVQDMYLGNKIFEEHNETLNRNDILAPYRLLKEKFATHGIQLDTQDITPVALAHAVLYNEMPYQLPEKSAKMKSYVFACETSLINPRNWIPKLHSYFKTVFTVMDYRNSSAEFIKVNFPQKLRELPPKVSFMDKKLCVMVSGAKLSFNPIELYSERIRWINWFSKNHPTDFDFYGTGWRRLILLGPIYLRVFNKVPYFTRLFRPDMTLYKGLADDKYAVLNQYKFSICYENAKGIPGNLTEKIFDCFFSNNVPIYLGDPDIKKQIPSDCFIDATEFKSFAEIYNFINSMPENDYNGYLSRAAAFIRSPAFERHSLNAFAETMASKIISDLKS